MTKEHFDKKGVPAYTGEKAMVPSLTRLIEVIRASRQNLLFDGATDEDLATLEQRLGKPLPPSFEQFIRETDGALLYQSEEIFGTKDNGVEDNREGLRTSIPTALEAIGENHKLPVKLPVQLIPFSEGGSILYFDATSGENNEHAVVRWVPEENKIEPVSPSFSDWLYTHVVREHSGTVR